MRISALLLALALVSAGCSWLYEGPPADVMLPPANLEVTFEEAPAHTSFSVEGGEGVIAVRDRTMTGICHTREQQGAYLRDDVVTLWLAHTGARQDACPALGVPGAYQATIEVPPGRYTVRVEYIGDISTDTYPRPELEAEVEVR